MRRIAALIFMETLLFGAAVAQTSLLRKQCLSLAKHFCIRR
jgi:hypothetical protein